LVVEERKERAYKHRLALEKEMLARTRKNSVPSCSWIQTRWMPQQGSVGSTLKEILARDGGGGGLGGGIGGGGHGGGKAFDDDYLVGGEHRRS
jgi:hypothetical protein